MFTFPKLFVKDQESFLYEGNLLWTYKQTLLYEEPYCLYTVFASVLLCEENCVIRIVSTNCSFAAPIFYLFIYLLSIKKNTVYKLMWWLYKVRYDTMYLSDVVGYSSSNVTSGGLQEYFIPLTWMRLRIKASHDWRTVPGAGLCCLELVIKAATAFVYCRLFNYSFNISHFIV